MSRRGFTPQKAAGWAPSSLSRQVSFAVRPLAFSPPAAAVNVPAPPVRLDFASHPTRSPVPTLAPVFPRMRAQGSPDALPETVDLPLETALRDAHAAGPPAEPLLHRFAGSWDASRAMPRPAGPPV
jgi:hypothetical protein